MSTGDAIRRSLETATSLGRVVSTMKALAAVRVHRYRQTMRGLDASTTTLDQAVRALLSLQPDLAEPGMNAGAERALAVVFGSDRGLCGPFNDRVARFAAGALADETAVEVVGVAAVGGRLASRLRAVAVTFDTRLGAPSSLEAIEAEMAALLDLIEDWRASREAGGLWLVYARPLGAYSFEPRKVQVLPIDPDWLRRLRNKPWPTNRVPMQLSEPQSLARGIIRQHMALSFVKAFASSLAAENSARLAAMETTSRNVDERIEQLRSAYQSTRQAAVTEELLDIQAAAEALA